MNSTSASCWLNSEFTLVEVEAPQTAKAITVPVPIYVKVARSLAWRHTDEGKAKAQARRDKPETKAKQAAVNKAAALARSAGYSVDQLSQRDNDKRMRLDAALEQHGGATASAAPALAPAPESGQAKHATIGPTWSG